MKKTHIFFIFAIVLIVIQPLYVDWVREQVEHIFGPLTAPSVPVGSLPQR